VVKTPYSKPLDPFITSKLTKERVDVRKIDAMCFSTYDWISCFNIEQFLRNMRQFYQVYSIEQIWPLLTAKLQSAIMHKY
jgi:hypothetical protein